MYRGWFRTLDARIAILEGDFEGALQRLKRGMRRNALPTPAYLLLAIAAKQTGDEESFDLAVEVAERRRADLTALGGF